jgi:hypothetical protein
MVVGLDKESRTPTLPTIGGVLSNVNLNNTFVETSDINDINYISEGFLSRYTFNLKAKSTGFFSKLIKSIGVVVVLAAAAVATIFTCGVAGAAFAGILSNVPAGFFRGLCDAADLGGLWNVRKCDPEWIFAVSSISDSHSAAPVWRKKTKKTRSQ